MMINLGTQFKKVNGGWRYYPLYHETQPDIYMHVKPGMKEVMEAAIAREWLYVGTIPVLSVSLWWLSPYLVAILLLAMPFFVLKLRRLHERKYCVYVKYSMLPGFRGYYKKMLVHAYRTSDNIRIFLLGSLACFSGLVVIVMESGFNYKALSLLVFGGLALFCVFNILHANWIVKKKGYDYLIESARSFNKLRK